MIKDETNVCYALVVVYANIKREKLPVKFAKVVRFAPMINEEKIVKNAQLEELEDHRYVSIINV